MPKFVRRYANIKAQSVEALTTFAAEVHAGSFPRESEAYKMTEEQEEALGLYGRQESNS